MENYSLEDVCTLLQTFNVPDKPYILCKNGKRAIYFRKITSTAEINTDQDTQEYLAKVQEFNAILAPERRVAFLFEKNRNKCAIIIGYVGLNQTISIQLCSTASENTDVIFVEEILMALFLDNMSAVNFQQIYERQKKKCQEKLTSYLIELQQHNPNHYQKILNVLGNLIKLDLLVIQQQALRQYCNTKEFAEKNPQLKQQIFALLTNDLDEILPYLSVTTMLLMLRLEKTPEELIRQLTNRRAVQVKTMHQSIATLAAPTLSWYEWGQQKASSAVTYCYQHTPIAAGVELLPWIAQEIMPSATIENNIWKTILQLIGGSLGIIAIYYSGIFFILFSLGLVFLTESLHSFASQSKINIANAQATIVPRFSYTPGLSTLLRLNTILLAIILSLYTRNSDIALRGITATVAAEFMRRLFNKFSSAMQLTEQDKPYFEYIITQLGLYLGDYAFGGYVVIRNPLRNREKILTTLTQFAQELSYPADFQAKFNWWPWSNFTLNWRDTQFFHTATCQITEDMVQCAVTNSTVLRRLE